MKLLLVAVFGLLGIAACRIVGGPLPKMSHVFTDPSEKPMEDRQIATLTEMVNAVNAGDAKRYATLYAQDALITIYGSGELKGRGAIEQYEVELLREFPVARLAFYAVWQKGPLAVVHYAVNGRTSSGQLMGHEGLLFFRFNPWGLIEQEHRYMDSMTPMAQMGMLGAVPARHVPVLPAELHAYVAKGSSNESANIVLLRASLATQDSKNKSAFLSIVAEDAILDELILPQPFVGKRNVKAWFETWTGAVSDANSEVTTVLGIADFVLAETIVHGTLKGPLGILSASHKEFEVHRGLIIQLKDRKLTRISSFMNGKELATAVDRWPPQVRK